MTPTVIAAPSDGIILGKILLVDHGGGESAEEPLNLK